MANARKNTKVLLMVQLAVFTAIEAVFCFTPLGSLPIGPLVATLAHIPALVCALVLGTKAGAYMGAVMGIFSLIWWTFMPGVSAPIAFVFTPFAQGGTFMSLVICLLPRIIFPVAAAKLFDVMKKTKLKTIGAASIAAASATFIHSFLVLGLIFVSFYGTAAVGKDYIAFVVAWAGFNALLEICVAALVCGAVAMPLLKLNNASKQQ